MFLPLPFLGMVVIYFVLNLGYSFYSETDRASRRYRPCRPLYHADHGRLGIRGIWPSAWLLAFSTFLFLSLALVKRYAELVMMHGVAGAEVQVRGYPTVDKELLASLGTAAAMWPCSSWPFISPAVPQRSFILAISLSGFYARYLLYWISYVWLIAHRGEMHDDPLEFVFRNRVSQVVILLSALIGLIAR